MSGNSETKVFEVKKIKRSNYAKVNEDKYSLKIILLSILLTTSLTVNLLQYINHTGFFEFLGIIFLDKNGKFEWAGVTAIITVLSVSFTVIVTVSKNKADLVSKSRIEWLQKVKALMSKYLAEVHYYPDAYFRMRRLEDKLEAEKLLTKAPNLQNVKGKYEKQQEVVDELLRSIEETQYLLLMNLSDNIDNQQINKCITDCTEWVNNMEVRYEKNPKDFIWKDVPVTNLMKVSRDYFKREWSKAKKGR